MRRLITGLLAGLGLAALLGGALQAQGYPTRAVRIIVPFAAGSGTDTVARAFAEALGRSLGQPFVVDNRPGANGLLGAEAAARAEADGYTLLVGTNSTNAAAAALYRQVPYDMERSFAPVSQLGWVPLVVGVASGSPVRDLDGLVALARSRPGELTFASASASQRVSTEMLAAMAGVRLSYVPYRAGPQAMQDLIAGRVEMFTADFSVMLPQIRGGTVRPLAVTSRTRSPLLPDVPTVEEAARLEGYELIGWFALFGPAGMPDEIVQRLNAAVREAAAAPELTERLGRTLGIVVATSSPAELIATVRSEGAKWERAARQAGIERE